MDPLLQIIIIKSCILIPSKNPEIILIILSDPDLFPGVLVEKAGFAGGQLAAVCSRAHLRTSEKSHPASHKKVAVRLLSRTVRHIPIARRLRPPRCHTAGHSGTRLLLASVDEPSSHPLPSTSIRFSDLRNSNHLLICKFTERSCTRTVVCQSKQFL